MKNSKTKRLFIALEMPENAKKRILPLISSLSKKYKNIKWVREEALHITLHFLGYLDKKGEDDVGLAIQSLASKFKLMEFELGGINAFPNLRNPRVVYLECKQKNAKSAEKLHQLLGQNLASLGLKVDKRPWKQHITLGRVKGESDMPDFDRNPVGGTFRINSVNLMQSRLRPEGARYSVVGRYELKE